LQHRNVVSPRKAPAINRAIVVPVRDSEIAVAAVNGVSATLLHQLLLWIRKFSFIADDEEKIS